MQRRTRFRQHLRGQLLVAHQQRHRVAEDRRRFAQQRIRAVFRGLLTRRVLGHVAFVRLQAVVGIAGGQRVGGQAQLRAFGLALLALRLVAVALDAAFGLVVLIFLPWMKPRPK